MKLVSSARFAFAALHRDTISGKALSAEIEKQFDILMEPNSGVALIAIRQVYLRGCREK